ncbi:h-type lectin domain protein [Fusarium subglutinans]|uniref:H-type lectin domain protein n=1 Tax=Gibberella subglutinans TaxID=42677 RepID=A0A8H5PD29_GIBSU|nr:h-type lectin domain protein [Fusarium subglutinans]KAF5594358.1 h-type lectin domain protein [Fusarium subglutinans]
MTRVDSLIELCESEGLSFDITTYRQQAGLGNIFDALKGDTSIAQLETLLWDNPEHAQEKGLLSSLKANSKATDDSVTAAREACHSSIKAIQTLEGLCTKAVSPSPDVEGTQANILPALNEAWNVLIRANESMIEARHGQVASTGIFLDFLSKRKDTRIEMFITDVSAVEAEYDDNSQERFLLESFYEALRLAETPRSDIWVFWAGGRLIRDGPWKIKNTAWKAEEKTYEADAFVYHRMVKMKKINSDGSMTRHPRGAYSDDQGVEMPYRIAKRMAFYVSDGQVVPTQETQTAIQRLEEDKFDFWELEYESVRHPPFSHFCQVWYQMQGTLNTLSGPNGSWRKADDYDKARSAISVREKLARSMDYIEEIEESMDRLNSNVLDPMLISFRDLISNLQDLAANILYGDNDDQQNSLEELITSTKLWTSSYKLMNDFFNKSLPIHFRDFAGVAEISDHKLTTQVAPKDLDWDQVVMGFEKIDLDKQKKLYSLIAHKDDQKNAPTITTYGDPDSTPVGARAHMLEIPKSGQSEFGRVSNWKQTKAGDYYEIPVTFNNTYTSKPNVICWLEGFEAHTTKNLRVRAEVTGITEKGCVIRIGSWWDTELVHINAVWFAHASDHPHIFTGGGSVHKYGHHSDVWAPFVSINFPEGKFKKRRPDIFLAISVLDTHHLFNTRCELKATNITQRGMKVSVDAWWDTYCYQASFSCIAFDPDFFQYASGV